MSLPEFILISVAMFAGFIAIFFIVSYGLVKEINRGFEIFSKRKQEKAVRYLRDKEGGKYNDTKDVD